MKLNRSDWNFLYIGVVPFTFIAGVWLGTITIDNGDPTLIIRATTFFVVAISAGIAVLTYRRSHTAKQEGNTIEWLNRYHQLISNVNLLEIKKKIEEAYPLDVLKAMHPDQTWNKSAAHNHYATTATEFIADERLSLINYLIDGLSEGFHNQHSIDKMFGLESLAGVIVDSKDEILRDFEDPEMLYCYPEITSDIIKRGKQVTPPNHGLLLWLKECYPITYSIYFKKEIEVIYSSNKHLKQI